MSKRQPKTVDQGHREERDRVESGRAVARVSEGSMTADCALEGELGMGPCSLTVSACPARRGVRVLRAHPPNRITAQKTGIERALTVHTNLSNAIRQVSSDLKWY